jgi:uncharacterized protein YecE (DUF72 family)
VKLWVGTSGYSYKEWLGNFYPERLPSKEMLGFYASRLASVEINNTFYRLPKEAVVASWAEQVPAEFRFAVKASQKITHVKRLKEAAEEVAYLYRTLSGLGMRLGPVLFQLPPSLRSDAQRLNEFVSSLPEGAVAAFEFRHPSWLNDDVLASLRARNCALCVADTDEAETPDLIPTATWGYLRLRRSNYSGDDLRAWKERILSQGWNEAYVFFKHESEGVGPRLAAEFVNLIVPER